MQNVKCEIVKGTSKKGNVYECVEFSIDCGGVSYRSRAFPSPLELQLIKKSISPINGIYSDTSLKD